MSYGLIGDGTDTYGPTIAGMKLLRQSVLSKGLTYPVLYGFVNNGETEEPKQLAEECTEFAKEVKDENLVSTLQQLSTAASTSMKRLALC